MYARNYMRGVEDGRHRPGRAGPCKMDGDVKIAVWRRLTPV